MKKVTRRAYSALLLACLIILGLIIYVVSYASDGGDWALFTANSKVYYNGMINVGTITDRNGKVLAHADGETHYYAEDYDTRVSCLHVVGDYAGNIGSGALKAFRTKLAGYNAVTGLKEGGGTVTLSIDSSLNAVAYKALAGRNGAVMMMNYKTGEILCMVSAPSYDPSTGTAPDGAYINRCIGASFVPGSVFKLVTTAAALENIDDIKERSFYCAGSVQIGDQTVVCTGAHGSQTIEQALANSCNVAFAEIALELGGQTLSDYAHELGFCSEHDINGITTKAGSFDIADDGTSLLAWSAIGQYNDLVTPYSMLRYVAAIANGGLAQEGTLLKGSGSSITRLLSSGTAKELAAMMDYTVTTAYGDYLFPNLDLSAKSGTAEVGDGTSHSWFTGFLNDADHPYAFVVVIEHGGGGLANAGALANTLLQAAVGE